MPWEIRDGGQDCPFEIVKQDTGKRVACHVTEEEAKAQMRALYANEPQADSASRMRGVVEIDERTAAVDNVDMAGRIITVIACPYEQATQVVYRNEMWDEVVSRSAFDGIERKNKIRVNREHDRVLTVGKVCGYYPNRPEGLVIDTYIARTPLGEETLELARDGILDGSVGMKVAQADQVLNPRTKTRRINKAFLDHFAFTADPAYEGAQVLAVRAANAEYTARSAPALAEYYTDPMFRWAEQRLEERADNPKEPYGAASEAHYADPGYQKDGVKRYPLSSAEKCRAAWSYINMPKNAQMYSAEHLAEIKGRIKAAAKKFGIEIAA